MTRRATATTSVPGDLIRAVCSFLHLMAMQCKECVVPRGSRQCETCWTPRAQMLNDALMRATGAQRSGSEETMLTDDEIEEMILRRLGDAAPSAVRAAMIRVQGVETSRKTHLLDRLVARGQIDRVRKSVGGHTAYFYFLPTVGRTTVQDRENETYA